MTSLFGGTHIPRKSCCMVATTEAKSGAARQIEDQ
jgi:hypothetical protein